MPKSIFVAGLFVVFVLLMIGCSVTGRTGIVKPNIEVRSPNAVRAKICADSIAVDKSHTTLQNVGTYAWGMFDQRDLINLEKSMRRMVKQINDASPLSEEEQTVYIVIRSYQVATSNNSAAALACVAWA